MLALQWILSLDHLTLYLEKPDLTTWLCMCVKIISLLFLVKSLMSLQRRICLQFRSTQPILRDEMLVFSWKLRIELNKNLVFY